MVYKTSLIKDTISERTLEIIEMELAEKSLKDDILSKLNKETLKLQVEISDEQYTNICT